MFNLFSKRKQETLPSRIERAVKDLPIVVLEERCPSACCETRANWFALISEFNRSDLGDDYRKSNLSDALREVTNAIKKVNANISDIDVRLIETITASKSNLWCFKSVRELGERLLASPTFYLSKILPSERIAACIEHLKWRSPMELYATDWDPRIGWDNVNGSHNLAALVALAEKANISVRFPAELTLYERDFPKLRAAKQKFNLFAIGEEAAEAVHRELIQERIFLERVVIRRFVGSAAKWQDQFEHHICPPMLNLHLVAFPSSNSGGHSKCLQIFSRLEDLYMAKSIFDHLLTIERFDIRF